MKTGVDGYLICRVVEVSSGPLRVQRKIQKCMKRGNFMEAMMLNLPAGLGVVSLIQKRE